MNRGAVRPALAAAALLAWGSWAALAAQPDPIEIWLASGPDCTACRIYEVVDKRHGYGSLLRYAGRHLAIDLPIKHVAKADLPAGMLPDGAYWAGGLTVLIVQGAKPLYVGDIAESADLSEFHFSAARMFPPAQPAAGDGSDDDEYEQFFRTHWNLEYFVAVALGERSPRVDGPFVDLRSPVAIPLAHTNVILWGAAGTPFDNHVFTARRLQEIRPILAGFLPPSAAVKYLTLYGHGPGIPGNDTSEMKAGVVSFLRADIPADFGADAKSLGIVLTSLHRSRGTRTLIVHAGHSGPDGAPTWGDAGELEPEDLADVAFSGRRELVMVSGGCNSGVFAAAVSCGFFAAHPEVTATGCQLTQEAIEKSDDYLRLFFASFTPAQKNAADSDLDGVVTLSEAHWYASTRIEDHQISYTSVDAMADDYFEAHPARLPASLTVRSIQALGRRGSAAERAALARLTLGKDPGLVVTLTDLVERNAAALERLDAAGEKSSAERNAILALPYKLMLPMLARRLIYERLGTAESRPVAACENRKLADLTRK